MRVSDRRVSYGVLMHLTIGLILMCALRLGAVMSNFNILSSVSPIRANINRELTLYFDLTGMLNFLIARRLFPAALTLSVNSCLWLGVNSNFIKRLDQSLRHTTSTQHRLLQTHYSAVHAV